jgi:hypothetical protein
MLVSSWVFIIVYMYVSLQVVADHVSCEEQQLAHDTKKMKMRKCIYNAYTLHIQCIYCIATMHMKWIYTAYAMHIHSI